MKNRISSGIPSIALSELNKEPTSEYYKYLVEKEQKQIVNQIKEILQPLGEQLHQNTTKANKMRSSADMHI